MSLRRHSPRSNFLTGMYPAFLITVLCLGQVAIAQSTDYEPLEDSTVVFEAEFFKQFQPVSKS